MSSEEELQKLLDEAYDDLDLAENKNDDYARKIELMEEEIQALNKTSSELQAKVEELEAAGAELDDASFDAAQEFKYKEEIQALQKQLDSRKNLEKQLTETKLELQEVRAQYEAEQFQQQRSTTRNKMKSLSDEKSSKEEVIRLQKDLRACERKLQQQQSSYEARIKANQESMQRIQEKNKAVQTRCDEMEKERLQLKVENGRLEKKLEKAGSYAEKKRFKEEQEAAEIKLKTMKKKHAKLEKRLSMSTQMLDMVGNLSFTDGLASGGRDSPISEISPSSSGRESPVPMTLSEARIVNMEKEMEELVETLRGVQEENQKLLDRATTAERNVESLTTRLKEVDTELFHERETNSSLEMEAETLRLQATTPVSPNADENTLQLTIRKLEKELEDTQIKFKVKEKDLWATIEAQKRQLTELEMDKIALEEQLNELDNDSSDIDEPKALNTGSKEQIEALEEELTLVKQENNELRQAVDKLQTEAREILESFENEENKEVFYKSQNEELKKTLEEKSDQYVDTIREIARLKSIIEDQENEMTFMKATQDVQARTSVDSGRETSRSNGTATPEEPRSESTEPPKKPETKRKRSLKIISAKPADEVKKPPPTKKKPKKKAVLEE